MEETLVVGWMMLPMYIYVGIMNSHCKAPVLNNQYMESKSLFCGSSRYTITGSWCFLPNKWPAIQFSKKKCRKNPSKKSRPVCWRRRGKKTTGICFTHKTAWQSKINPQNSASKKGGVSVNEISGAFEISRFQFSSPGDWKDGRNPARKPPGDGKDLVNSGVNYLPINWARISSINRMLEEFRWSSCVGVW